ncbi:MAG: glycosyltransferase family 39 protein [Candidatus Methanoperedens sp.]|nr:glycosyltransferase family 39 protein [Candidatus Methanoperedens sp.]
MKFLENYIILLIGISLSLAGFLPERIKVLLSDHHYADNIDKTLSKYGIPFLCFLIVIGFYLRFNNLGHLNFWIDELYTIYAAIGIIQQGAPVFPSGVFYDRSILNTYLIALSFKIFGINESSARIVSVVFSTLTIPLVYLMGARIANRRVGILAALIMTISVWEIVWAREARMYAQFQFLYLLTAYLFYLGLTEKDMKILFFSLIAFIGAVLSHEFAMTFLPVALIYILLSKKELFKNKYFLYRGLAIFGLVSILIVLKGKDILNKIISFQNVPLWGQRPFYYYALDSDLRILFFLVLLGITVSVIMWKPGNKSQNSYLLLNFFIPFFILSAYSWKESRYSLYIFPFLVLSASYAIDMYLLRDVIDKDAIDRLSRKFKIKKEFMRNIKFAFLFLIVILLFVQIYSSKGAFSFSQKDHGDIYGGIQHSNWKKGSEYISYRLLEDDKIMTTLPAAVLYYLRQPDYYIKQIEYDYIENDKGQLVDAYTGRAIILNSYDSFIQAVNSNKGWVIVDYKIERYYTDQRVREYIRNNMTFHPDGSDDTIEVYSWNN